MRGVAVFIIGLFTLTGVTMVAGMALEPIVAAVASDSAVQSLGWSSATEDIADTILRWMPLLWIVWLLIWGGVWYFRTERLTGVTRR